MHYSFEATVLTTHTAASPLCTTMKLGTGVVRRIQIDFPFGCGKNVRCLVASPYGQVLPTNQNSYYALDGSQVDANLNHDLQEYGNVLYLYSWGIGIQYQHVLTCMVEVQGPDEPDLNGIVQSIIAMNDKFLDIMKRLI